VGDVNLSKNSAGVVGKQWKNQEKTGKMAVPDYFVKPYNETAYSLQASNRKSGDYSTQWCEVEMKIKEDLPKFFWYEM